MTHDTREEIYNLVKEVHIQKPFEDVTGEPHYVTDEIMKILHQELQKARETWLREEIVKLEGVKKKGNDGKGLPFENSPEIYGNARMKAWKN